MISDVTAEILDSGSRLPEETGTGKSVKIGICGDGVTGMVAIRNTMDVATIKAKLGDSPMAAACMDTVENGAALVYCMPVAASTKARIGEVEKTGTGSGTVEVSGNAYNAYNVVIRVDEAGGLNAGACSVSTDGGNTFSETQTIPLSGSMEIAGTGLKLTFKDGSGQFAVGDTFRCSVTAPAMSNGDVLKAVDTLAGFSQDIEFVHIVGETNQALWTALELKAQQLETRNKRPLLFVVEQRMPGDKEDAGTYAEAIKDEARGIGRHIVVVQTCGKYIGMDGSIRKTNVAGIISGLIAMTRESTSIAYVRECSVPSEKLTELYPAGIEEYMELLDAGRYVTLRKYNGRTDWYVTSSNTAAKASSDYAYIENCRVMYRIVRDVCKIATELQNMDYDGDSKEVEVKAVQEELMTPVDDAKNDRIISDGTVTILMDEIGETTGEMPVRVELTRRDYIRKIALTFLAANPSVGEEE